MEIALADTRLRSAVNTLAFMESESRLMQEHREAMECTDWERMVAMNLVVVSHFVEVETERLKLVEEGGLIGVVATELQKEFHRRVMTLSEAVLENATTFEKRGYDVARLGEFRDALSLCREMSIPDEPATPYASDIVDSLFAAAHPRGDFYGLGALKLSHVARNDERLELNPPLEIAQIRVTSESGDDWTAIEESFNLDVHASSEEDLHTEIAGYLWFLWDTYACGDETRMDGKARELAIRLRSRMTEVSSGEEVARGGTGPVS